MVILRTIACDGSLSDSSEELFQRGKGGARIHRSLLEKKKKKPVVEYQEVTANHTHTKTPDFTN